MAAAAAATYINAKPLSTPSFSLFFSLSLFHSFILTFLPVTFLSLYFHRTIHIFFFMLESKYIGLILALCSSILIGTSFVITKKGLQQSSSASQGKLSTTDDTLFFVDKGQHFNYIAFASDSHRYLKSPIWWIGLTTMVAGELLNFIGETHKH